jgi:hypothetical protein
MARGKSIEHLHRTVLNVRLVPNTRILEIACTLPNADTAHFLALRLAGQTLALSRGPSEQTDHELIAAAEKRLEQARVQLEQAYSQGDVKGGVAEARRASARETFEDLEAEAGRLRGRVSRRAIVDHRWRFAGAAVVAQRPPNVAAATFIGLLASVIWVT